MNRIFFLTCLLSCQLFTGTSAVYPQVSREWVAKYNGPSDSIDIARSVKLDNSGNVFVTGVSFGAASLFDFATIKYNSAGRQLWSARYNGSGNSFDEAYALAVDDSGNVYVTGYSSSSLLPGSEDITTIKYNSNGVQQWVAAYNGAGNNNDRAYAIVIDNTNSVIVAGFTQNNTAPGSEDIVVIKYSSNGTQQWASTFNGAGNNNDRAYAIVIDNTDNIYAAGYSFSQASNYDYITLKYNSSGTQQWASYYNGNANNDDRAYAIVIDNANNPYILGSSIGIGTGYDYATVKYNSSGTQQWASRFNGLGSSDDRAYAIVIDNTNNICVTGSARTDTFAGSENYATVLYNAAGVQQWAAYYNGPGNNEDAAYAIASDNLGNFYVTGSSRNSSLFGSEDFATVKYNSSGTQQWEMRYNGTAGLDDKAYGIVVDNSLSILVTGYTFGITTNADYTTIKYSQSVGITPVSNKIPSGFHLYQNYPNPFNPVTVIRFDIPSAENVRLVVSDILGHHIASLLDQKLNPGTYEYEFSALQLPSGIYFYRLSSSLFTETKKLILLR